MSVSQIAELSNLSKAYISQVEHGSRPPPQSLSMLLLKRQEHRGQTTLTCFSSLGKQWE